MRLSLPNSTVLLDFAVYQYNNGIKSMIYLLQLGHTETRKNNYIVNFESKIMLCHMVIFSSQKLFDI